MSTSDKVLSQIISELLGKTNTDPVPFMMSGAYVAMFAAPLGGFIVDRFGNSRMLFTIMQSILLAAMAVFLMLVILVCDPALEDDKDGQDGLVMPVILVAAAVAGISSMSMVTLLHFIVTQYARDKVPAVVGFATAIMQICTIYMYDYTLTSADALRTTMG